MTETIEEVKVLDYGYVRFIEHMGSDQRVIENARQSTSGAFQGWGPTDKGPCQACELTPGKCKNCPNMHDSYIEHKCHVCKGVGRKIVAGDEKLLNYLWKNGHISPFECCAFTVEIQAPIFVFRQLFRHRSLSPNEYSGRYTEMLDINYLPTTGRMLIDAQSPNKQAGAAKGAEVLTYENAIEFQKRLQGIYAQTTELYQWALKVGVPKELARIHLPVAGYSRARISGNLRNWLHCIDLRSDHSEDGKHSQWEIRQFLNPVGDIIKQLYPRTFEVYKNNQ